MSKSTNNKRWMVQSLLRMAEITGDEVKRSEYLIQIEELMEEINEQSHQINEYGHKDATVNMFIQDLESNNIQLVNKSVNDIYVAYVKFCENNDFKKLPKNEFSKRLQRQVNLISVVTKVDGKSVRIYRSDD